VPPFVEARRTNVQSVCVAAVLSALMGWVNGLHSRKYVDEAGALGAFRCAIDLPATGDLLGEEEGVYSPLRQKSDPAA
jgi:hypothetical protein